jgi:hypothetical protein
MVVSLLVLKHVIYSTYLNVTGFWSCGWFFAGFQESIHPAQATMYGQVPAYSQPSLGLQQPGARTTYSSDSGAQHSYSLEEKVAFADYLNQYLADDPDLRDVLPIDPHTDDLFKLASQGLLLWFATRLHTACTLETR